MSTLPPLEKYKVREVIIGGHTWPIVLQARGGGSSILVTLANAVLQVFDLRTALKTEGGGRGRPKYVRTEVLCQLIEMAVVQRLHLLLKEQSLSVKSMVALWKQCRHIIRLLRRDYGIDPIFTSCKAFAESDLDVVFNTLGFQVYHGSVIDPEKDSDTAIAIGSRSLNEIFKILNSPEVEKNTALLMKFFLNNPKARLTSYGLTCLKQSIGDGDIGILFRYDHFSLLCKVCHLCS